VDKPPRYDYMRKDASGNIYIYIENKDSLMYDFSRPVGTSFSSAYPGMQGRVMAKYDAILNGDTVAVIEIEYYNKNSKLLHRAERIVENYGLFEYTEYDQWASNRNLIGESFGRVVNGKKVGTLFARGEKIDWTEFYPMHAGDYWVYRNNGNGKVPTTTIKK
jgi:hypothetical protein